MYKSKSTRTNSWRKSKAIKKIDGDLTSRQSCRSGLGSPWTQASSESVITRKQRGGGQSWTLARCHKPCQEEYLHHRRHGLVHVRGDTQDGAISAGWLSHALACEQRRRPRAACGGRRPSAIGASRTQVSEAIRSNTRTGHDASHPPMHQTKHNLQVTKKASPILSTTFLCIRANCTNSTSHNLLAQIHDNSMLMYKHRCTGQH
jgi:hypothetical protein